MVGVVGLEPTVSGSKPDALTTWRHPNKKPHELSLWGSEYTGNFPDLHSYTSLGELGLRLVQWETYVHVEILTLR